MSNNGKTAIARRFQSRQVLPEDPQAERSRIPVALIQAPNGPRIPQLLAAILAALGREVGARVRPRSCAAKPTRPCRIVGLRLLLIDDLHNMKGSNAAAMLVELREIGSVTGVSLGCFATKEIAYVLRQDEQLANRLELFVLPRWRRDDPDYLRLLATFERALPLRQRSILTAPKTAARILAMGEGLIGGIARACGGRRRKRCVAVMNALMPRCWIACGPACRPRLRTSPRRRTCRSAAVHRLPRWRCASRATLRRGCRPRTLTPAVPSSAGWR